MTSELTFSVAQQSASFGNRWAREQKEERLHTWCRRPLATAGSMLLALKCRLFVEFNCYSID
jgi:hypothetical protein